MTPYRDPADLARSISEHGADDFQTPLPSWREIAFWTLIGLVAVPAFLTFCGSIRL